MVRREEADIRSSVLEGLVVVAPRRDSLTALADGGTC
jgi:hypothetical protein